MPNGVYNRGFFLASQKDLDSTTLQLMLVTTGYVFNPDHTRVSYTGANTSESPAHFEITVGNYARQTVGSVAAFQDDANDFVGLDAADTTYLALAAGATIGAAVSYLYTSSGNSTGLQTTGDSGQDLLAYYQVTPTPTNGGDITIQWASTSAGGFLKIGSTS